MILGVASQRLNFIFVKEDEYHMPLKMSILTTLLAKYRRRTQVVQVVDVAFGWCCDARQAQSYGRYLHLSFVE